MSGITPVSSVGSHWRSAMKVHEAQQRAREQTPVILTPRQAYIKALPKLKEIVSQAQLYAYTGNADADVFVQVLRSELEDMLKGAPSGVVAELSVIDSDDGLARFKSRYNL
jgi:hypothetical protein